MYAGDDYRIKAAEMYAKAKTETNPWTRAELEYLALAYLRLADQADRNATLISSTEQPAAPLQQQPQSKRQRGEDAE